MRTGTEYREKALEFEALKLKTSDLALKSATPTWRTVTGFSPWNANDS
jgi:hypothetical protein